MDEVVVQAVDVLSGHLRVGCCLVTSVDRVWAPFQGCCGFPGSEEAEGGGGCGLSQNQDPESGGNNRTSPENSLEALYSQSSDIQVLNHTTNQQICGSFPA